MLLSVIQNNIFNKMVMQLCMCPSFFNTTWKLYILDHHFMAYYDYQHKTVSRGTFLKKYDRYEEKIKNSYKPPRLIFKCLITVTTNIYIYIYIIYVYMLGYECVW